MMTKIQGEGLENKGGVNEGPTTPRPAPPKGHAPEANSEGRAEPGQVEWPPPGVEWPPPGLETSGLHPPAPSEDGETLAETVRKLSGGLDTVSHRPGSSEFTGETFPRKAAEPSAPSEDEGEELGKRLYEVYEDAACRADGETIYIAPWASQPATNRAAYRMAALLFRAECVGPFKALEKAARRWLWWNGDSDSEVCEVEALREAVSALPNQGEATKDKSRRSDEELGAFAVNYLHGYLGTAITISLKPEDNAEYGAAIRARLERK